MTDPMQQARELSSPDEIAFRLRNLAQNMAAGSGPVARDHQAWKRVEELAEAVAALRAAPEGFVMVPVDPTREMLDAGRAAVMAEHCASPRWTPRQHYEASGRSMAGIPEDVLDERGPLTKESVAVMVFGTMVAHRPQEASDA